MCLLAASTCAGCLFNTGHAAWFPQYWPGDRRSGRARNEGSGSTFTQTSPKRHVHGDKRIMQGYVRGALLAPISGARRRDGIAFQQVGLLVDQDLGLSSVADLHFAVTEHGGIGRHLGSPRLADLGMPHDDGRMSDLSGVSSPPLQSTRPPDRGSGHPCSFATRLKVLSAMS